MDAGGENAHVLTGNAIEETNAELSPDNSQAWFLVDANEKGEPYYGHALFVVPASGGAPPISSVRVVPICRR